MKILLGELSMQTETYVLRIHKPEPGFEQKIFDAQVTDEQLFQSEVNLCFT
jgi:hypothetical protein